MVRVFVCDQGAIGVTLWVALGRCAWLCVCRVLPWEGV